MRHRATTTDNATAEGLIGRTARIPMPEIMAMAWLNVTWAGCDCLSVGAVAMMTALDTSDVKKRAPPVASCPAQTASPTTAPHDPHAIRIRTVPIRHSPNGPPLDLKIASLNRKNT